MTMKKVVKLDQNALRGLIKEAIQGRQPGSPLFTPPAEKKSLKESQLANDLPGQLADTVEAYFASQYDEGDPSMAAVGQQGWEMQCADAAEEFATRVNELLEEIETKLVNGEFYFEDNMIRGGGR